MKRFVFWMVLAFVFVSCSNNSKPDSNYHNGTVTFAIDPSLYDVVKGLTYRYTKVYPNAHIKIDTVPERVGLKGLLEGKYQTIAMARPLTKLETLGYKQATRNNPVPAFFGADALVFIVPKGASLDSISYQQVKSMLTNGSKKFLINGPNSSNTDYLIQTLHLKPNQLQYVAMKSDLEVIDMLPKYKGHVGIIGLNTISRPFGSEAEKLRAKIKILAVVKDGKSYLPQRENLRPNLYPFTRLLYFLTTESGFGIAKGVFRYSGSQVGQLIVEHNGLQPYYLYPRQVVIQPE